MKTKSYVKLSFTSKSLEKSPGKWEVSVMDIPVSEGWIIWLYFVVEGV